MSPLRCVRVSAPRNAPCGSPVGLAFGLVDAAAMDYPRVMASVGDIPRPRKRASQDETAPFPLDFVLVNLDGRRSQDETAPFPLRIAALPRKSLRGGRRHLRDEASPLLLTLSSEPEAAAAAESAGAASSRFREAVTREAVTREAGLDEPRPHSPRVHPSLPRLTWRGFDASSELRAYAARIAAGEELPPFSGPILASDEPSSPTPSLSAAHGSAATSERDARAAVRAASVGARTASPASPAKIVLGLMLLMAALVASATAGDDAALRAAGQSISRWLTGNSGPVDLSVPAPAAPASLPCVATAPAPGR
jgi:hypothetical protein